MSSKPLGIRPPTRLLPRIALALALACLPFAPRSASAGNKVVAWGAGMIIKPSDNNDFGQSIVPASLTNAVYVVGGWRHSLAVTANPTNSIHGWGDNSVGQLDF